MTRYFEGGLTYSMPLEGLSKNSANFVLFWENDVFSARVAYNYRDSFLSNRANTQGNPVFTDGYGQLDASANWTINKMFTVSVNAINLNNEARYQYFLTPDRMLAHRASGRRSARCCVPVSDMVRRRRSAATVPSRRPNPNRMFCATVMWGHSAGVWNTKPMPRR